MSNMGRSDVYAADGIPNIRIAFEKAGGQPKGWLSDYFINADKERVFYARIPALNTDGKPPRGSVVVTTGYNDSVYNNYDEISNWQTRGYDVYAMDWASQGASQRNPDHPNRPSSRPLDKHVRDMDQFVREVIQPEAQKPLILSTHSMGGAIGALYLREHPNVFTKAILGAPMLDLDTSILPREWFKKISHVANDMGLRNTSLPNWRNTLYRIKNFEHVKDLIRPSETLSNVFTGSSGNNFRPYELKLPTWGWVESAYQAMDRIKDKGFFKPIKTEILFVSAGQDELVDNDAIARAARETPNARHLHLETSQHSVWNASPENKARLWSEIDHMVGISSRTASATPLEPAGGQGSRYAQNPFASGAAFSPSFSPAAG